VGVFVCGELMSRPDDFSTMADEMFDLYRAGEYSHALELVDKNAAAYPGQAARITFWRVCLLSRCGRNNEALSALANGLDSGLWWHESQFRDTDLDSIRDLPGFKKLVEKSQERWVLEGKSVKPDRTILVPSSSGPYPLLIALHGYNGDKDSNLKYWELACRKGWLVLSPQSRQPLYPGAYCWDTPRAGIEEILFHLNEVRHGYRIDGERIVVGGFSQGGGMAILAALSPQVPAVASLSLAAWWEDVEAIQSAAKSAKACRSYFVSGLKDHTLDRSREIQAVLKENQIPVEEEVHSDLGHEFPPDFGQSFENALKYLFS
jgi:predicted esterase